jgi:hypothetical protein
VWGLVWRFKRAHAVALLHSNSKTRHVRLSLLHTMPQVHVEQLKLWCA